MRPTGQRSPRRRSTHTPYRYRPAATMSASVSQDPTWGASSVPALGGPRSAPPPWASGTPDQGTSWKASPGSDTHMCRPRRDTCEIGRNNDRVTAAPAIAKSQIHSLTRPNMVSVGTIVWLSSELMFFAALLAMYFSIRAAAPGLWRGHIATPNRPHPGGFTVIPFPPPGTRQFGGVG